MTVPKTNRNHRTSNLTKRKEFQWRNLTFVGQFNIEMQSKLVTRKRKIRILRDIS